MVAHEVYTGEEIRLWRHELLDRKAAPFPTDKDTLLVAYFEPRRHSAKQCSKTNHVCRAVF
jgi:hypothetical protein